MAARKAVSLIFSIVVCTYHRPGQLRELLQSLDLQEFPHDRFEVILVDDSGEDILGDVITSFRDRLQIRKIVTAHAGPAPARRAGVEIANGEFLAFTDDDCRPAIDWLQRLYAVLVANPGTGAGGPMINALTANPYSAATQLLVDLLMEHSNHAEVQYISTANAAFPLREFRKVDALCAYWSTWGGEDREMCRRWLESGRKILFDPATVIYHYHGLDLAGFLNQHYRYGIGSGQFHRKAGYQGPEFYSDLLTAGLRRGGAAVQFLIYVAQAATLAGHLRALLPLHPRAKAGPLPESARPS